METIIDKYFGVIYDFITDELEPQVTHECTQKLMELLERAENRLSLEIELREFVCEKLAKVVHS